MKSISKQQFLWIYLVTVVALLAIGGYGYYILDEQMVELKGENAELSTNLESETERANYLVEQNAEKQYVIDTFQSQIEALGGTVGTLTKLAQTDEELLRKYSKVYFLSENYVPSKLLEIDVEYVYNGGKNHLIHADVWPRLRSLLVDANDAGVNLLVASAFRSFDTQGAIKANYSVTYGSGANTFSADQGYSEHQLGTSVDFTTKESGAVFIQDNTEAYEWLLDNAHKYGFILSYPDGNSYYKFEPWHWRYVGVELATHLHKEGQRFYDLTQREIDEYLIKLFD